MDAFIITSLGKRTYRTRVVRHNLNPVFEEKLVFQLLRHELTYSLTFAVIDRDQLSGNDYVGTATISLDNILAYAPEADPITGLYRLPEPDGNSSPLAEGKKSRFRLPISRTSSSSNLQKSGKTETGREAARTVAQNGPDGSLTLTPTLSDSSPNGPVGLNLNTVDSNPPENSDLRVYEIPVVLKNKEKWEKKHNTVLIVRAKYLPYKALQQQFWRAVLKQYDTDENGTIDKVELTTMLDSLGSTLHESTIEGFFQRFSREDGGAHSLTFDQAVICLEDQLQQGQQGQPRPSPRPSPSPRDNLSGSVISLTVSNELGEAVDLQWSAEMPSPDIQLTSQAKDGSEAFSSQSIPGPAEGEDLARSTTNGLEDERGEEHVVEIQECPICHQPRLNKRSDADIITHIATCASQDWRQVNNFVMGGFVTSSQAQRKWYAKVMTKISYGGYKLGANSANILVQDRSTGQITEERMSVYVRLGIRLMYKGLKSKDMEKKRSK